MILLALALEATLVVDGFVVGSKENGRWTPAGAEFSKRQPSLAFRRFGIGTAERQAAVRRLTPEETDGGTYVDSDVELGKGAPLLAGRAPKAPRPVAMLDAKSPLYADVVRSFLARKGLKAAPKIQAVYRGDLDGDGSAEVVIQAGDLRQSMPDAPNGAYSLVLLRALKAGKVAETALEFDRQDNAKHRVAEIKQVRGIADLDGDGRMEILTTGRGYEWNNATLWSYGKGTVWKLLTNGVGH